MDEGEGLQKASQNQVCMTELLTSVFLSQMRIFRELTERKGSRHTHTHTHTHIHTHMHIHIDIHNIHKHTHACTKSGVASGMHIYDDGERGHLQIGVAPVPDPPNSRLTVGTVWLSLANQSLL